ncbi:site-specific integrase [Sunxiuqinia sp. sy24]|uniref:site-specific integrase n=1 Tax=Sunxiuqinia sp. sy24 TaxID=3461495 RepID=UPI004045B347
MAKHATFSVIFVPRAKKNTEQKREKLYARITVDGLRVEMSLARDLSTGLFNTKAQRCLGTNSESRQINDFLSIVNSDLNEIRKKLMLEGKEITAELIKARYKGLPDPDDIPDPTVLELYDEHNRKFKELIGTKNHSPSTYQRHLTSRGHVAAFIQHQYGKNDLTWEKVDFSFLSDFEHYFKAVRKCNHNSTMKYIKNFGKVIRTALGEGYLIRNPFEKFKLSYETVDREILTQKEVDQMIALDIKLNRLDKVRDLFVFCIHTGVSFCDVIKLRMNHIYEDQDGTKWIKNKRLKTGVEFMVPVLPEVQKIIDKYADHPERQMEGSVIPEISNQNYNGYLKEVAMRCEIDKNLSSHIARHTFATTIAMNNGAPLEVVSKMLGHRDTKTTQIYAKIQEKAIKSGMRNLL